MPNHVNIYQNFWNPELTIAQSYRCAYCDGWYGGNVHHILKRKSGGSKHKCFDYIENLVYLCTGENNCHKKADENKEFNKRVRIINLRMIADQLEGEL